MTLSVVSSNCQGLTFVTYSLVISYVRWSFLKVTLIFILFGSKRGVASCDRHFVGPDAFGYYKGCARSRFEGYSR